MKTASLWKEAVVQALNASWPMSAFPCSGCDGGGPPWVVLDWLMSSAKSSLGGNVYLPAYTSYGYTGKTGDCSYSKLGTGGKLSAVYTVDLTQSMSLFNVRSNAASCVVIVCGIHGCYENC